MTREINLADEIEIVIRPYDSFNTGDMETALAVMSIFDFRVTQVFRVTKRSVSPS